MTVSFSVFLPVWNGAGWLPGAIESVLGQSYDHWELVIGDNASTEDVGAVVAAYRDPRVRYHRWSTHTDIFENFNRTMLLCDSEWVQLLCVDDRLHPRCLETMAARIEAVRDRAARLTMVLTAARRVTPQGHTADHLYYGYMGRARIPDGLHGGAAWLLLHTSGITPWNFGSVAIAREVVTETGGFRPEIGHCADVELALRISAYGDVLYVDERLLDYTVSPTSDVATRAFRKRAWENPLTSMGAALLSALSAHQERREVSGSERAAVYAAVARWQLQRAFQHRYRAGGWGRRGTLLDVTRALWYSPGTLLSAQLLAYALTAILAPRIVVEKIRNAGLARQYPDYGDASLPVTHASAR
jgi:glycosyltransferase involved in cell wall biosynthesis